MYYVKKKCKHCDRMAYARELCIRHYERDRKGIPPEWEPDPPCGTLDCVFPDCGNKQSVKKLGLCNTHYMQHWHGKELHPINYRRIRAQGTEVQCKECNRWKPREDFYIKKTGFLVSRRCKKCYVERASWLQEQRKLKKAGVKV